MVWCVIALAIALLAGEPSVMPACGVPAEPPVSEPDYMDPKGGALPDGTASPVPTRRSAPRPGATVMGVATWYDWRPGEAAAGPALRRALGPSWRGSRVRVRSGSREVVVRLTDWCACGPRNGVPTVIDLDVGSFEALAPRSAGVLKVEVIVP